MAFAEDWATQQAVFMLCGEQSVGKRNIGQAARYAAHMSEEAAELRSAFLADDLVMAVDGAVNLIVVAIGFLHSVGVDPNRAWAAVHAANMRKVDGTCGPIIWREDGQLGKPIGWYGPEAELERLVYDPGD